MSYYDPAPTHDWNYGPDKMNAIRVCDRCGAREAYWDDEEYGIESCHGEETDK